VRRHKQKRKRGERCLGGRGDHQEAEGGAGIAGGGKKATNSMMNTAGTEVENDV
jgi:hypothetical protein